jgi:hypothetical protein
MTRDFGKCGQVVPGVLPAEENIDIGELLEQPIGDQRPDLVRDTLWAYEHLADLRTRPIDAPSAGAWVLLQWARRYQDQPNHPPGAKPNKKVRKGIKRRQSNT